MATRRIGLNGSRIHIAFVAENLNMSFPLLMTTKVCEQVHNMHGQNDYLASHISMKHMRESVLRERQISSRCFYRGFHRRAVESCFANVLGRLHPPRIVLRRSLRGDLARRCCTQTDSSRTITTVRELHKSNYAALDTKV